MAGRRRLGKSNLIPVIEEPPEPNVLTAPDIDIPWTGFQVRSSGDMGHRSHRVTIPNTLDDDYGDLAAMFQSSDDNVHLSLPTVPTFEEDVDDAVDPSYTTHMEETSFPGHRSRSSRRSVSHFYRELICKYTIYRVTYI